MSKFIRKNYGTKTTSIPIKKQTDSKQVNEDKAIIADTIKIDSIKPKNKS